MEDPTQRVILLDVRAEEEFAVSHLRGAVWVAPSADGAALLEALEQGGFDPQRSAPADRIVAYCSLGYRSSQLCQRMQALPGVDQARVANLEGSIFQWCVTITGLGSSCSLSLSLFSCVIDCSPCVC